MKKLYILLFSCLLSCSLFAQNERHQSKDQNEHSAIFEEGQMTIKLKAGVGDYEKQTGLIYFGIPSLDEKVQEFGVYQIEKHFNFNTRQMTPGLHNLSRIYNLSYNSKSSLNKIVKAFSSDPNVEYAEGIPILKPVSIPDDSLYEDCQHLPQIMAEEAWEIHKGEDGTEEVVIAIIDGGVSWNHVDLVDNVWQNLGEDADGDSVTVEFIDGEWVLDPDDLDGIDDDSNGKIDDLVGWDFLTDDPNPNSTNGGHGTRCAGIACGTTNNGIGISSISYNLKLMGLRVSSLTANNAILYAALNGADIISFSWGGWAYSVTQQDVITTVYQELGCIVVCPAGNTHKDEFFYPASYLHVLSVANVYYNDVKNDGSTYSYAVDISAPGTSILSTTLDDEYTTGTGTSYSCPMIAGAIGLLKSYHPDWSNEELIKQVIATADDIDYLNPGFENLMGSGRLNAYEMLLGENLADPYLKLDIVELNPIDNDGDDIIEAGDSVVINMDIRNFMQIYGAENASLTLTSTDPFISIVNGEAISDFPADTIISFIDEFIIAVDNDAETHLAEFNLHIETDGIDILVGEDISFYLMIAPSGYFVYDGIEDGEDFSGEYINNYLNDNGFSATYGVEDEFPESLVGFDAIFLSFGNYGSGSEVLDKEVEAITEFIASGGDVYIEGGDVLGYDQTDNPGFLNLFGISSSSDGFTNPIGNLEGQTGALTEGMNFPGSSQISNLYIDSYGATSGGAIAFIEDVYGNVAVQHDNTDYQTFAFSYALAKLNDGEFPGTKDELIQEILYFFDYATAINDDLGIDPFSCIIYPNPSHTGTTLRYHLPKASNLSIQIMNSRGQIVVEHLDPFLAEGQHEYYWDASEYSSGVYYYSLESERHKSTGKIVLLK